MSSYNEGFYNTIRDGCLTSAQAVVPIVMDLLHPKTVVDIGCGEGVWLSAFQSAGCDILGVDGAYVEHQLVIPRENFVARDLSVDWALPPIDCDLAVSLEVAEHLPAACAEEFVHKLCALSDVVLFSAAIPGQGGTGHVNEQWPWYWTTFFRDEGYRVSGALRWMFWDNPEVENWYRQNLLLCIRNNVLLSYQLQQIMSGPTSPPWPVIHPMLWDARR